MPSSSVDPVWRETSRLIGVWRSVTRHEDDAGRAFAYRYTNTFFDAAQQMVLMRIIADYADGESQLVWEGFKVWDPSRGRVVYHAYSPSGRGAHGGASFDADGRLVFEYDMILLSGRIIGSRDVFRAMGPDRFATDSYLRDGGTESAPWRLAAADEWFRVGDGAFSVASTFVSAPADTAGGGAWSRVIDLVGDWRSAETREDERGRRFRFDMRIDHFDRAGSVIRMVIDADYDDGSRELLWLGYAANNAGTGEVDYHAYSPSGRGAAGGVVQAGDTLRWEFDGYGPDGAAVRIRDDFVGGVGGGFSAYTFLRRSPSAPWTPVARERWEPVSRVRS